ncbi:MAG: DsbA family protein [Kosmotoga sp.]|nr:MAG: DsbA family protein [Kosmotoga sp.]
MQYFKSLTMLYIFLVAIFIAQINSVFAQTENHSKATKSIIKYLNKKSQGKADIIVKKEIRIPESDFYYVLLDFSLGDKSKELSFITNGKYITNALIDLKTGKNLAKYYESISKTIDVKVSKNKVYFGEPKNAKVEIIVFSDFECPYCKKMSNELGSFFNKHKDDIVIYYKHFPLSFHKNAKLLAKIYEAGKHFGYDWNMYQYSYKNKSYEEITGIFEKKLKEDEIGKFYKILNSPSITQKIKKNMKQGKDIGVRGTPYLLINSHPINGYQPELIKNLIKKELEK